MRFEDDVSEKIFTRRAFFIAGLQIIGLGILGGRLAWLQIAQGARYKTLSDKNRISIKILPPSRGQILDRFGVPLAVNTQNFQALIIPELVNNLEESMKKLRKIIDLEDDDVSSVIKQASRRAKFIPIKIKDNLTWEEVARIEVNLPDLPGLSIERGEARSYPYRESTAHIVGYVRSPSQDDLAQSNDPVLKLPGFKIGKTGIEKVYDTQLRGRAGASEVEVNVVGREVRELKRQPAVQGERVVLTIDGELQRYAMEALSIHKSASAVIMDAQTGAIYAMASHPAFDPNQFARGLTTEEWQTIRDDPALPQTNKAIAGQYPPGSTFKMITALAGLKSGLINENTSVRCPGHFEYGNHRFHCWKKQGHGSMNLTSALAESCDTYFYKLAVDLGIEKIAAMARQFGLGQLLDLELTEEKSGLIPDKIWKKKALGERWHNGETIVASIGQGFMLTTPLQLAVMTARMVNGGIEVMPWMSAYLGDEYLGEKKWNTMDVSQNHLKLVMQGMDDAVNAATGTAYASRIAQSEFAMAGKTGTAQVQRITKEQRRTGVKNEDLPWEQRHHALFVGYAPTSSPKYVCSVVVEHGVGGSKAAAPLAKALLEETQRRDPARKILKPETTTANAMEAL